MRPCTIVGGRNSTRVDERRNGCSFLDTKNEGARTVVGRGEKSLLTIRDPGSELRLGREGEGEGKGRR